MSAVIWSVCKASILPDLAACSGHFILFLIVVNGSHLFVFVLDC